MAACVHTGAHDASARNALRRTLTPSRPATGFDPIGFSSDPKKKADLQMKELANGRLAMFAFGGVVTQAVLTGHSFPYFY